MNDKTIRRWAKQEYFIVLKLNNNFYVCKKILLRDLNLQSPARFLQRSSVNKCWVFTHLQNEYENYLKHLTFNAKRECDVWNRKYTFSFPKLRTQLFHYGMKWEKMKMSVVSATWRLNTRKSNKLLMRWQM
jgi:hypothetical protein